MSRSVSILGLGVTAGAAGVSVAEAACSSAAEAACSSAAETAEASGDRDARCSAAMDVEGSSAAAGSHSALSGHSVMVMSCARASFFVSLPSVAPLSAVACEQGFSALIVFSPDASSGAVTVAREFVLFAIRALSVFVLSSGASNVMAQAATQAAAIQGQSVRRGFLPCFLVASFSIRRISLELRSVGIAGRADSSCRIASRRQSFMLVLSFMIVIFLLSCRVSFLCGLALSRWLRCLTP